MRVVWNLRILGSNLNVNENTRLDHYLEYSITKNFVNEKTIDVVVSRLKTARLAIIAAITLMFVTAPTININKAHADRCLYYADDGHCNAYMSTGPGLMLNHTKSWSWTMAVTRIS